MVRLNNLAAELGLTRSVELALGSVTVNAVVRPQGIQAGALQRINQLRDVMEAGIRPGAKKGVKSAGERAAGALLEQLADMVAAVLVSWDLLDDDGLPVPTDEATLRQLGLDVLGVIQVKVMEAAGNADRPNA